MPTSTLSHFLTRIDGVVFKTRLALEQDLSSSEKVVLSKGKYFGVQDVSLVSHPIGGLHFKFKLAGPLNGKSYPGFLYVFRDHVAKLEEVDL